MRCQNSPSKGAGCFPLEVRLCGRTTAVPRWVEMCFQFHGMATTQMFEWLRAIKFWIVCAALLKVWSPCKRVCFRNSSKICAALSSFTSKGMGNSEQFVSVGLMGHVEEMTSLMRLWKFSRLAKCSPLSLFGPGCIHGAVHGNSRNLMGRRANLARSASLTR